MTAKFYVAKTDLYVGPHVRAHREGDLVGEDAVKTNGWDDLVKAAPASATPAPEQK